VDVSNCIFIRYNNLLSGEHFFLYREYQNYDVREMFSSSRLT